MKIAFDRMKSVALFSHIRPDGDTLGAMFGMREALSALGKEVDCFCDSPLPDDLAFLDPEGAYNRRTLAAYDTCIALDCADVKRLGAYESLFYQGKNTYNIDHHGTNPRYADTNIVEDSASTCEIVYDLLVEAGISIDQNIAAPLYGGIVTDTGSFSQANTTAHSHVVAAELLRTGIDVERLHNRLMKVIKRDKLMLIADRVRAMRFFDGNRISVLTVETTDLDRFACLVEDTEGLINYALNVEGVCIAASLTQSAPDQFKVSLRCRRGYNVAAIAESFGGGGHIQAAGCCLRGLLEEVVEKLVRRCELALPVA